MVIRGECGSKRGGHFELRVWRLISTMAADGIRPYKKVLPYLTRKKC